MRNQSLKKVQCIVLRVCNFSCPEEYFVIQSNTSALPSERHCDINSVLQVKFLDCFNHCTVKIKQILVLKCCFLGHKFGFFLRIKFRFLLEKLISFSFFGVDKH